MSITNGEHMVCPTCGGLGETHVRDDEMNAHGSAWTWFKCTKCEGKGIIEVKK